MVSGSHDRSLRRWDQTEELVYPETERKKEMDRLFAPAPHELISATSKTPGELKATESGLAGLEGEISTASLPTLTSYKVCLFWFVFKKKLFSSSTFLVFSTRKSWRMRWSERSTMLR